MLSDGKVSGMVWITFSVLNALTKTVDRAKYVFHLITGANTLGYATNDASCADCYISDKGPS